MTHTVKIVACVPNLDDAFTVLVSIVPDGDDSMSQPVIIWGKQGLWLGDSFNIQVGPEFRVLPSASDAGQLLSKLWAERPLWGEFADLSSAGEQVVLEAVSIMVHNGFLKFDDGFLGFFDSE
jgi:hypothetical protein